MKKAYALLLLAAVIGSGLAIYETNIPTFTEIYNAGVDNCRDLKLIELQKSCIETYIALRCEEYRNKVVECDMLLSPN